MARDSYRPYALSGASARGLARGGEFRKVGAPKEPAIRFFASSHNLQQLAPRTRVLCSLFLLGILAQAISGGIMQHLGAGWTPASVAAYYRGDPQAAEARPTGTVDERFGSADDADVTAAPTAPRTMQVARSFGSLVEVAHLHLVAMPLVLFVVAHLFSMTAAGRTAFGGALCYAGFVGAALDILAPFAVRYVSAGFAPLKLVGFFVLEASLIAMVVMTLIACIASFSPRPPGTGQFSRAD